MTPEEFSELWGEALLDFDRLWAECFDERNKESIEREGVRSRTSQEFIPESTTENRTICRDCPEGMEW